MLKNLVASVILILRSTLTVALAYMPRRSQTADRVDLQEGLNV